MLIDISVKVHVSLLTNCCFMWFIGRGSTRDT